MPDARRPGPWVDTIAWDDADGVLKEAYDWQAQRLGEPTDFTMLGSLYPDIVMERLRLYRTVEACPSGLSPVERQAAAYVTSLLNGTSHCASGLRVKLRDLVSIPRCRLASRPIHASRHRRPPPRRHPRLRRHAHRRARPPSRRPRGCTSALGLADLDIVDLNNMVAYYNYINRVANGLGLFDVIPDHHALRALPR